MNTDNMIVRGQIEETRDGGPQQTVKASGRAGETYGGQSQFILRIQAHGPPQRYHRSRRRNSSAADEPPGAVPC